MFYWRDLVLRFRVGESFVAPAEPAADNWPAWENLFLQNEIAMGFKAELNGASGSAPGLIDGVGCMAGAPKTNHGIICGCGVGHSA